jgi:hypothetical protein
MRLGTLTLTLASKLVYSVPAEDCDGIKNGKSWTFCVLVSDAVDEGGGSFTLKCMSEQFPFHNY